MKIARIEPSDTYSLRHQLLRSEYPMEKCKFTGDDKDQSFHLGGFMEDKLVSIASFYFEHHKDLPEEYHYRLRGMATISEYRGKGFSSELLKMAFPIIKQNFCSLLWCNARIDAIGFYQKVGFEITGEDFDIPEVGVHKLMYKKIN